MRKRKAIDELLSVRGLKFECPKCEKQHSLKRASLFDMRDQYPPKALKSIEERIMAARELHDDNIERRLNLEKNKIEQPKRIERGAHSSNFGKQSEHILPAFLNFPYRRDECRVVLQPVDYIYFQGLSNHGRVEAIKFVEVKTGAGRLTSEEACVQAAIASGTVRHRVVES